MRCTLIPGVALKHCPGHNTQIRGSTVAGAWRSIFISKRCVEDSDMCHVPSHSGFLFCRKICSARASEESSQYKVFVGFLQSWQWHGIDHCVMEWFAATCDCPRAKVARSTGTAFFSMKVADMLHPLVNMDHDWLQCLYCSKITTKYVYSLTHINIYWLAGYYALLHAYLLKSNELELHQLQSNTVRLPRSPKGMTNEQMTIHPLRVKDEAS